VEPERFLRARDVTVLIASHADVFVVDVGRGDASVAAGIGKRRPTCLAADPLTPGRAWCGARDGVLRSDDLGVSWRAAGLDGRHVMSFAASPTEPGVVWAGTEPSAVFRSDDGGETWSEIAGLNELPSAPTWAFPPKPETHHVRWILCHPHEPGRLWAAIEAGALVSLHQGREWRDRAREGPYDTHEAAVHPGRPESLRVAAGDGYYESDDGGRSWRSPRAGLEVGYLRSVAIDPGDPDVVLVSASSGPYSAYVAGRSDGRLYRRVGSGAWQRVAEGWPREPTTIAPLLVPGTSAGELWAADERGLHRSADAGRGWQRAAEHPRAIEHLRGLAVVSLPLSSPAP
jgi:photosystem II stability/assembly factor-like uncharacterized protein